MHWRLVVISVDLVREHGVSARRVVLGDGLWESVHPKSS